MPMMPPGAAYVAPVLPHNILLASNLPDSVTDDMLNTVFRTYPGFKEVRRPATSTSTPGSIQTGRLKSSS